MRYIPLAFYLTMVSPVAWGLPPQPQSERARIFLRTEGPSATIWQLEFSPDSRVLYAAGNDKVVHRWLLPDNDQNFEPRYLAPLRWPFSRGSNGSIYALAVPPNPDSTEIAIAGLSAYAGDKETLSFLWDSSREEVVSVHSHAELKDSVTALDFSPDLQNKRLLARSLEGDLSVENLETGKRISLRVPKRVESSQPAIFINSRHVAAAVPRPDNSNQWDLVGYDVENPNRPVGTFRTAIRLVTDLARQPDGELWASAERHSDGAVICIWNGDNPRQVPTLLKVERSHVPYSLSFSGRKSGLLALALEENTFGEAPKTVVHLYDVRAANRGRVSKIVESGLGANREKLPRGERFACALSRDGRWLAASGSRMPGVTIFNVQGREITPTQVQGSGRTPWRVAWNGDAKSPRMGISFERSNRNSPNVSGGPIRHEFDFDQLELNEVAGTATREWRSPNLENWHVKIEPAVESGGQRKHDIVSIAHSGRVTRINLLDPATNKPLGAVKEGTYCMVSNPEGPEVAIAIGTDDENGIFLYELLSRGGEANLIRYFRDHSGPVRSLSVSSDGRFLASAAEDQTVKVWSLARLFEKQREQQVWGCEFGVSANNEVIVRNALPGSIAARRGLVTGTVVEKFYMDGRWHDQPQAMIPALQSVPVTKQFYMVYRTPQKRQEAVIVVPAWEPLVTLFVRERGRKNWALFTPEGYFDCSLASGNELFGFQVLQDNKSPINLKASEMQKEFRQRAIMKKLLSAGNLEEAFLQVFGPQKLEDREPMVLLSGKYARRRPLVQISYQNQQPEQGDPIGIQVEVSYPEGKTREDFDVQAFLNGVNLQEESRQGSGKQDQLLYTEQARNPLNRFKLIVNEVSEQMELGETREVVRYLPTRGAFPAPDQFNLYAVALAADDYNPVFPGTLNSPVRDADSFLKVLAEKSQKRAGKTPFFNFQHDVRLFNEKLNHRDFENELGILRQKLRTARPEDLLVVLLVGHGEIAPGTDRYYFLPGSVRNRAAIVNEGFSWDRLAPLTELPCRKLFVIDTCHAGQALPSLIDELKKRDCLVMCSSAADQKAAETNYSQDPALPDWHMIYLNQFVRGLSEGTADLSQDGEISLWECAKAVEEFDDLPSYGFHEPRELFQVLDIPLAHK